MSKWRWRDGIALFRKKGRRIDVVRKGETWAARNKGLPLPFPNAAVIYKRRARSWLLRCLDLPTWWKNSTKFAECWVRRSKVHSSELVSRWIICKIQNVRLAGGLEGSIHLLFTIQNAGWAITSFQTFFSCFVVCFSPSLLLHITPRCPQTSLCAPFTPSPDLLCSLQRCNIILPLLLKTT